MKSERENTHPMKTGVHSRARFTQFSGVYNLCSKHFVTTTPESEILKIISTLRMSSVHSIVNYKQSIICVEPKLSFQFCFEYIDWVYSLTYAMT